MKLSQFKNTGISKRLSFVDGEVKIIDVKEEFAGDVNFYHIDVAQIAKINKDVIGKLSVTDSNDLFMYEVMPYLSDVEVDVTFEEFATMLKSPTAELTAFMNQILIGIGEIFNLLDNLKNMKETSENVTDSIMNKVGKVEIFEDAMKAIIEKEPEVTKEEKLEKLYEELASAKDKEERKTLIKQISELEVDGE